MESLQSILNSSYEAGSVHGVWVATKLREESLHTEHNLYCIGNETNQNALPKKITMKISSTKREPKSRKHADPSPLNRTVPHPGQVVMCA